MTAIALRWRVPPKPVELRWRGPAGMLEAVRRNASEAIAGIVAPPGPPGADAEPLRINASLSSTWILDNPLGRIPFVQVFLGTGEAVIADVEADTAHINVTFPSPQQGFVLAF